jgi:hypothetical protein
MDGQTKGLWFIRDASDRSLQDFELARRASAANLTKQLRVLLHQIVDDLADAELARAWREGRAILLERDSAPASGDELMKE